MSLLWLTFLTIFVGIFIAFVFFGRRTRIMGLNMNAHTFPEFLGLRFNSRTLQGAAGGLIFLAMPLYASVVLMGGAKFVAQIIPMYISHAMPQWFTAIFMITLLSAAMSTRW
jgi:SSS family solute:Na+ symporter